MPMPSVEPSALPSRLLRLAVPDEAQDASYFAASARISSFWRVSELGHAFDIRSAVAAGKGRSNTIFSLSHRPAMMVRDKAAKESRR